MISTKGRYALRFLTDMAKLPEGAQISLKEIAERQNISMKYMESIVKQLVKSEFIGGQRGRKGGYRFKRPPQDIRVADVLVVTEGTLAPVACLEEAAMPCPRMDACDTLPMWKEYYRMIREYFGAITIADLASGAVLPGEAR